MFDSELVIVCHCPVPTHPQIYYVESGKLGTPIGDGVKYVDPESCPSNNWDTIEDNSKTYVWGIQCPVYPMLEGEVGYYNASFYWFGIFIDILNNSWRVLKNGGSLIFPTKKEMDSHKQDKLSIIQQFINENERINNNWNLTLINANDYSFNLGYINRSQILIIPDTLYVFTKIADEPKPQLKKQLQVKMGGGRRRRCKFRTKKIQNTRKKFLSKKRRTRSRYH
jgi:hypothetical protein